MLLYWRQGKLEFTTDVEDWMSGQLFTEIFSYNGHRRPLKKRRWWAVTPAPPVNNREARPEGTAVDEVFKDRLRNALDGRLKRWKHLLSLTPRGARGADVISSNLHVALDVTTVGDIWKHVERDVFGKRAAGKPRVGDVWDRYYLLVWDEPRTNRQSKVREIQAGRLQSY
jgi:hypothetical protein